MKAMLAVGGAAVLLTLGLGTAVQATKPNPEHKVTICHRTDARTNPYVKITVDVASILHNGHDDHNGPIFTPALAKHVKWGDIIPPFNFGPGELYTGQNFTTAGQTILNNNCQLPSPPTTTTTTQPVTTTTGTPGTNPQCIDCVTTTSSATTTTATSPTTTSTTQPPVTTTTGTPGTNPQCIGCETTTSTTGPADTTTTCPDCVTTTTEQGVPPGEETTTTEALVIPPPGQPSSPNFGPLPFTGDELGSLLALGSVLTGGGLVLARRRRSHRGN